MQDIQLIATDLDGTLIGSVDEFPLYFSFRDRIMRLRRENDAVWAVCSGRTRRSFRALFAPMKAMGLEPEVVILRHAYIYTRGRYGYKPHVIWNLRVLMLVWLDRISSRRAIGEWHALITRVTHGVKTVRRKRDRLWLRFRTEEAALYAATELRKRVNEYSHFRVFHYRKEVDVRSVPFTKGMALKELAGHLNIRRENILSIGNGHNDISILDGTVSGFTGCPSNSEPEVMEVVHEAGGHVAQQKSLSGVLEIIDAVVEDRINSELPVWWEDPAKGDNPKSNRGQKHHHSRENLVLNISLAIAAAYTVLLVFASFDLIPFGSGWIIKPFRTLLSVGEEYLSMLLEWWYGR